MPGDEVYADLKQGSGNNKVATTMALVRLLKDWMKDPEIGRRIVPIAPDEFRTFGMDSMFPSAKIYNPGGQKYESVDRKLLLKWRESDRRARCSTRASPRPARLASATAAGSAYSTHGEAMIPFYIFYSMFGFQRTGDSIWAMADQLARGFLIGATAGRTTLTGEGLQHADGHSPLLAATNPAVVHYDPAHAHEIAHIMQDGLRRMYTVEPGAPEGEDVIFYLTVYNEPVSQPAEPDDLDVAGLLKGVYHFADGPDAGPDAPKVQLMASGVGFPWIREAQRLLAEDWGVSADLWSVTSWNELAREAIEAERWSLLHPDEHARVPFVTTQLGGAQRSVRGGLGLHARRAAADRALGARRLPRARHRRLRLRRHPPGRATGSSTSTRQSVVVQALQAWRPGRGQARGRGRGVRQATASTTPPRSPGSPRRAATREHGAQTPDQADGRVTGRARRCAAAAQRSGWPSCRSLPGASQHCRILRSTVHRARDASRWHSASVELSRLNYFDKPSRLRNRDQ